MAKIVWDWFAALPPSTAGFLGTLTGSTLGLLALLIGALFNAHLNRKRDDRLRDDDRKAVATALVAELSGIADTLTRNAVELDTGEHDFLAPDLAHQVRVMPVLLPKLGLLNVQQVRDVIDAYVQIDQYCEALVMLGGTIATHNRPDRRLISMPGKRSKHIAQLNRKMLESISKVIADLIDSPLGRPAAHQAGVWNRPTSDVRSAV